MKDEGQRMRRGTSPEAETGILFGLHDHFMERVAPAFLLSAVIGAA